MRASHQPGSGDGLDPEAEQWEHVSVHAYRRRQTLIFGDSVGGKPRVQQRTPTWKEMAHVKDTCWDPDDIVVQFHPAKSNYVNVHPHVLHLWRNRVQTFPMPPVELV